MLLEIYTDTMLSDFIKLDIRYTTNKTILSLYRCQFNWKPEFKLVWKSITFITYQCWVWLWKWTHLKPWCDRLLLQWSLL